MVSRAVPLLSFIHIAFTILQKVPPIHAGNDWSQPCFSGTCSYDLPETPNGASGTLRIWGAQHAIGDITPAGGWEMVSCDPSSSAQDLRIVCQSSDDLGACAHLFDGSSSEASSSAVKRGVASSTASAISSTEVASAAQSALTSDGQEQGAVGKIVRLPENCGKSAFARIAKAWVPTDQSIPPSIAKRLVRRGGETPVVKAFTVDVDFGNSDVRYGPVGFTLVGANVPGAAAIGASIGTNNSTQTRRSLSGQTYTQRGLGDFVGDAVNAVSSLNDFDVNKTTTLQPLDINNSTNLIDQQIDCSADAPVAGLDSSIGINGHVKVDVDAKVHALVSLGVAASGTIVPPKVEQFGITSGITADINGSIIMSAGVGGTLDSGKIPIFEIGVPGLDFHGILSIGPTLEVNAEASATLDLDMDMTVGVNYHIEKAEFVFPDGGKTGGTFTPGDTPLKLSVQPSGTATGTVEAHLIPTLNFGINALGNTVDVGVFVNLDASATATLGVGASGAQKNVTLDPRFEVSSTSIPPRRVSVGRLGYAASPRIRGRNLIGEIYFNSKRNPEPFGLGNIVNGAKSATKKVGSKVKAVAMGVGSAVQGAAKDASSVAKNVDGKVTGNTPKTTTSEATATTKSAALTEVSSSAATTGAKAIDIVSDPSATNASATFGGCVEMDVGLNVNVGADANFFGLFDASTTLPLFEKSFTLFKKCFGDSTQVQRRSASEPVEKLLKRVNQLECNDPDLGEVSELANEVVLSSELV